MKDEKVEVYNGRGRDILRELGEHVEDDPSENRAEAIESILRSMHPAVLKEKVKTIKEIDKSIQEFLSVSQIDARYSITPLISGISKCITKESENSVLSTFYGFIFISLFKNFLSNPKEWEDRIIMTITELMIKEIEQWDKCMY